MKAYGKSWNYNFYGCKYCTFCKGRKKGCVFSLRSCCCPVPQKPPLRFGITIRYYRYINGVAIRYPVHPRLGGHPKCNTNITYSMDFSVTPHQLRHTYITNLIHAGVDPKTVQYLAGHKNSRTTMDVYAKVKYNRPEELYPVVEKAFIK